MIVGRHINDLELRVKRECDYVMAKYPTLAFNCQTWEGNPHGKDIDGKNVLLAQEAVVTLPKNYDIDWMKSNYDAVITYSTKFKELYPEINVYNVKCPTNWEAYHWLEDFKGYDDKIRGICSLQHVYDTGHLLDANYMKHKVMVELETEPHLLLHTYGQVPFGKAESYQGYLGHRHSNYHNLKKINEYMFCYAAECIADDFWGHDYLTERVFNTFKSKTVLIYYGATNVQELLPEHIFVDVRKFPDMGQLSEYLIELSYDKERYNEMVNEAYQWNIQTLLGDIRVHEQIWQKAIKENKL